MKTMTTLELAKTVNMNHRSVLVLLESKINSEIFEGVEIIFEKQPSGKSRRIATLTGQQVIMLVCGMKNTPTLWAAKERFVQELFAQREEVKNFAGSI